MTEPKRVRRWVTPSLPWWGPVVVVALAVVTIGAVSGPFAGVLFALAGLYVILPASIVFGGVWLVYRSRSPGFAGAVMILLGGWAVVLVGAAFIGAIIAGIPFNMRSELGPFLAWLYFTAPFACLGVVSGGVCAFVALRSRTSRAPLPPIRSADS